MKNAKAINDSLIELRFVRKENNLLRSDTARLHKQVVSLKSSLSDTEINLQYISTLWNQVSPNYKILNRKNKIIVKPKGREKRWLFDLLKISAGFFLGKI